MNRRADVTYIALMGASALLGPLHRRVEGVAARRWTASCVGVAQIFAVMGARHAWHVFAAVALTALLVRRTSDRYRHAAVGAAVMLYLIAFKLYTYSDWLGALHRNFFLMHLTLKLFGVAFETRPVAFRFPDEDSAPVDPGFADILHYAFCYIGLLSGPYIRYRTYDDFIKLPYSRTAVPRDCTKKLIGIAFLLATVFVIAEYWPLNYMVTEDFAARGASYKILYPAIQFLAFRARLYAVMLGAGLSATAAGLGAYPVRSECRPGHGPTKGHRALSRISPRMAATVDCDFVTVASADFWHAETTAWLGRVVLRWNMTVQYLLGAYVHKSMPMTPFRATITMLISALWHGVHPGYLIGTLTLPMLFSAEKYFMKIHQQLTGWRALLLKCGAYVVVRYIASFAMTILLLPELKQIITYCIQIKFLPYILIIVLHVTGLIVARKISKKMK